MLASSTSQIKPLKNSGWQPAVRSKDNFIKGERHRLLQIEQ